MVKKFKTALIILTAFSSLASYANSDDQLREALTAGCTSLTPPHQRGMADPYSGDRVEQFKRCITVGEVAINRKRPALEVVLTSCHSLYDQYPSYTPAVVTDGESACVESSIQILKNLPEVSRAIEICNNYTQKLLINRINAYSYYADVDSRLARRSCLNTVNLARKEIVEH